jgi:hypothetical protein
MNGLNKGGRGTSSSFTKVSLLVGIWGRTFHLSKRATQNHTLNSSLIYRRWTLSSFTKVSILVGM